MGNLTYEENFVKLCRLTCCEAENYGAKSRVKKNNHAMERLAKLQREMYEENDHCATVAYELLNHDEICVRLNAGAYCIMANVHKDSAILILREIIECSEDVLIQFTAENILKYCRPYEDNR